MEYRNETVLLERKGPYVALMTMNNPPMNVLTLQMAEEFHETLDKLSRDEEIHVVVLTGAGKRAFGCGSDIRQMMQFPYDEIEPKNFRENRGNNLIESMDKIFIAAMEGVACGGGLELALSCDMRIMAHDGRIALPEVNLGLYPGGGGVRRLPRLIPPAKALELMLTGEFLYGDEALRLGVVNHLAPHGETVSAALALADKVAAQSFDAVKVIKRSMREMAYRSGEDCFDENNRNNRALFLSREGQTRIRRYLDRHGK